MQIDTAKAPIGAMAEETARDNSMWQARFAPADPLEAS